MPRNKTEAPAKSAKTSDPSKASKTGATTTNKPIEKPALSMSDIHIDQWRVFTPRAFVLKNKQDKDGKQIYQWEDKKSKLQLKPSFSIMVSKRPHQLSGMNERVERLFISAATYGTADGLGLKSLKETRPQLINIDGVMAMRELWTAVGKSGATTYGLTYLYPEKEKDIVIFATAGDMTQLKSIEPAAVLVSY